MRWTDNEYINDPTGCTLQIRKITLVFLYKPILGYNGKVRSQINHFKK